MSKRKAFKNNKNADKWEETTLSRNPSCKPAFVTICTGPRLESSKQSLCLPLTSTIHNFYKRACTLKSKSQGRSTQGTNVYSVVLWKPSFPSPEATGDPIKTCGSSKAVGGSILLAEVKLSLELKSTWYCLSLF